MNVERARSCLRGAGLLGLALLAVACRSEPVSHPEAIRGLAADPPALTGGVQFSQLNPDELPPAEGLAAIGAAHPYILGIGDVLRIVGDLDFLRGFGETSEGRLEGTQVKEDGNVYLPRIGPVAAAGRTTLAVQADLGVRLSKYSKEPYVSVDVLRFRSQEVLRTRRREAARGLPHRQWGDRRRWIGAGSRR